MNTFSRLTLSMLGLLCIGLSCHAQKTIAYAPIPGMTTSTIFKVEANSTPIWVEKIGPGGMEDLHVASFAGEGLQNLSIEVPERIVSFRVRPTSRGVVARSEGNRLSFSFQGPGKYYVQVNDYPYLAIFADSPEKNAPTKGSSSLIYYGPGVHEVGRLNLEDGKDIYIAQGALLKANIVGSAKNVRIYGRGSMQGNISVSDCENLRVEDIFMRSTRGWTNTVRGSRGTVYRNVKVFSHSGTWGLDGINPCTCDGFLIEDCFIRTRDDCIAVKAYDNNGVAPGCRNVTVRGCILVGWDHADGVTLGFELNGGPVENILVTDCDVLCARGSGRSGGHSAFSIVCDGASDVRNITFDNIRVESEIEYKNLEIILTEAERYGNGKMGSIKGVTISNVSWENPLRPIAIVGHPTRFVEDVSFSNCYIGGKLLESLGDAHFQIEYARGISINGASVEPPQRYPLAPVGERVPGQRGR